MTFQSTQVWARSRLEFRWYHSRTYRNFSTYPSQVWTRLMMRYLLLSMMMNLLHSLCVTIRDRRQHWNNKGWHLEVPNVTKNKEESKDNNDFLYFFFLRPRSRRRHSSCCNSRWERDMLTSANRPIPLRWKNKDDYGIEKYLSGGWNLDTPLDQELQSDRDKDHLNAERYPLFLNPNSNFDLINWDCEQETKSDWES